MKMTTNTFGNKKVFRIALYSTCPIFGKLKISKEGEGYLKYYDAFGEITVDLDNYNKLIIESIINQAEVICLMKSVSLVSY